MIKCISGNLEGKTWYLPQQFVGDLQIGRSSDCHIQVKESTVSAHHCIISQIADERMWAGVYILADQNSTHSTFVNGVDVVTDGVNRLVLFPGVQFSVGKDDETHTFEVQFQKIA